MSVWRRFSVWAMPVAAAAVLAMSWTSSAFAQVSSDGDGLDGDELGLSIIVGIGVLAYLGWAVFRRRSRKSQ
jgi:hypothetical protein